MVKKLSLFLITFCLSVFSLLILASINPGLLAQQASFFLAGIIIFFLISRIDYQDLENLSPIAYLFLIILLLIALLSRDIKGSSRWIELPGGFHLQASQLALPIVVLFLNRQSKLLQKKISLREIFKFLTIIALPAFLIFIEPDLSTSVLFILAAGSILFFMPLKLKHFLLTGILGLLALSTIFLFLLKPHQIQRLTSFAGAESSEENYNSAQSLIAVGSGKLWGRGLGLGVQSHLRFLPERQTDFIFASLAEETGFIGSAAILGLYFILLIFIYFIAINSQKLEEQLYCFSIAIGLSMQIFINIAMNMNLLPITGLTLPLVSYGGSSIISTFITLAPIQSIAQKQKTKIKLRIKIL